jgi:hypothetical protein
MPFTNPAVYFRTITTTSVITPDPSNLPVEQILEFPSDGDTIVELIDNKYQNNVSIDPATNPNGSKKVHLQDNGRLEDIIVITGKIDSTDTTFINKFKTFSRKLQIEASFHRFGIFGIAYPNTPSFDLDPNDTVGYFIDTLQLTTRGQAKGEVTFILTLKTGGTLV